MRRRLSPVGLATFVGAWLTLAMTAPGIPIVWDEGEYIRRAEAIVGWFHLGGQALTGTAIRTHWLFINYTEGHPAGFAIPIAFSSWLFSGVLSPLTAARLGPITLFSAACAAVAGRLRREYGLAAAIVAPIALLTFPRIFSDAHFATLDGQLTAWWLILWTIDSGASAGLQSACSVGVALGLTTAAKFTGWLAWVPVIAWRAIDRNAAAFRALAVSLPVALITFFALNPPLWVDPTGGWTDYFHRNLDRAHTYSVPILFLGRVYDMQHPLPWYNTIAWVVLVTPVPTLVLGAIGLWDCLSRRTRSSVMLLLHGMTLMVARSLPAAPPHDGIRLFLPAFGFWCVFAGIGAQRVWDASKARPRAQRAAIRATLVAALAAAAGNLARYYPQTLSHYSLAVGGLRGAAVMGMEPAYWWDALDNDVLSWLNEHTDPGRAIAFSPVSNMTQLHNWHRLRPRDVDPEKEDFQWYVLQNRPGMFTRRDRNLMSTATPAFTKYAGRRPSADAIPWDLDVPLILVFSHEQYLKARP